MPAEQKAGWATELVLDTKGKRKICVLAKFQRQDKIFNILLRRYISKLLQRHLKNASHLVSSAQSHFHCWSENGT